MGSPATFWPEALPWARQAHAGCGVLTSVILSQWAIETGYGGPDWSPNNNPGNVGSFDGQPVNKFPTLAQGVAAYVQTMRLNYYTGVRLATGWQAQSIALGNSPWASAHYRLPGGANGSELVYVIEHYNLTQYDGAQPAPIPTPPTPAPPPIQQETDMSWFASDPKTGGVWATDPNGDLYPTGGAPFVAALSSHPEYHAGSAESGGTNPCVGMAYWSAFGNDGVMFFTQPTNGQGGWDGSTKPGAVPYDIYRFLRSGSPA